MQQKAGDITHILCGQTLHLMPERCVFWQEEQALLVADLHLGKEGTFRAAGIPLPDGPSRETLERLKLALERTEARRLFVLGDLFHGENAVATVAPIVNAWRHNHPVAIDLMSGSHDRWSGELPKAWQIRVHHEPFHFGPFTFCHYPEEHPQTYCLAGHLHPGVLLKDRSNTDALRLPCFWFGKTSAVLPAFGFFTGLTMVKRQPGCACFVIADTMVVPLQR